MNLLLTFEYAKVIGGKKELLFLSTILNLIPLFL